MTTPNGHLDPKMKSNTERLNVDVILKLEDWVDRSGAIFNSEKMVPVHFTQNGKKFNIEVALSASFQVGGKSTYGWK